VKVRLSVIALVVAFVWITPHFANGQELITAYSILKHRGENRVFCINFGRGARPAGPCYFRYGALYVGPEHDWLESSTVNGNRSVIKDLGPKNWSDQFSIPVVEPLRELQPGEQRMVIIDSSGADGADGADGAHGVDGADGADGVSGSDYFGRRGPNGDRSVRPNPSHETIKTLAKTAAKPKHDGKLRVDPMFVRAVVGHMYVVHVVNPRDDFYVLFRVESIERGSTCTISWMQVPAPAPRNVQNQK